MSGYDLGMVANQGYSLATDAGWYNTNQQMGEAEREEMYRCEVIDIMCDLKRRMEKYGESDEED